MKIKVCMDIEAKDKEYDNHLKKADWKELDIEVYHNIATFLDDQGFYVHGGSWKAENGLSNKIKRLLHP